MRMPALFVGHGSPMNAITVNKYTEAWKKIGESFNPKAIIMISAHWFTKGTLTQNDQHPKKINDMYGFPQALYNLDYPVNGLESLGMELISRLGDGVKINNDWGIDHGAWAVLVHMYPEANIPIVQLSVNKDKLPKDHFDLGKKLSSLRDDGYMIIASGNVVHNLGMLNGAIEEPFPWAEEFDNYIEESIKNNRYDQCINYLDFGHIAKLAVPTTEHYYPLLTLLGSVREDDEVSVFNKGYVLGSLSMTSYIFNN